jgi:very-short-patch-repair endonuclease
VTADEPVVHRDSATTSAPGTLSGVSRPAAVPTPLRRYPFRGRDAVAAGLLTKRQLNSGPWRKLFPNVYLHHAVVPDHRTRCLAAALFVDGSVVSHASAAYLYGADVLARNPSVELSVLPERRRTQQPGLVVHRTRLDPGDTRTVGSIPVTTPVRTAFDLARNPDLTEAVVGLDALLHRGVTDVDAVGRYLADHAGWPRTRQAAVALRRCRPLAESPMETRLRLLLVDAGCPEPTVQHPVGRYRLDLAYPQLKLAIEYDGDHHRDRAVFRADVERLNELRALGWTVLRFTAADLRRRPDRLVAQVLAVVRGIG